MSGAGGDVADILEIRPRREKSALDAILGAEKKKKGRPPSSRRSAAVSGASNSSSEPAVSGAIAREVEQLREGARAVLHTLAPPVVPGGGFSAADAELGLLDPQAPAVMGLLKERRKLGAAASEDSRWVEAPFVNPARTGDPQGRPLVLRHWARRSEADSVFEFARYGARTQQLPRYSNAEYERLFAPSDAVARWTRADTDALLDLCERFDLRWPVVVDRFPGERSMEELKERFYYVVGAILRERAASQQQLPASLKALASFEFARAAEEQRKAMADRLFRRTHEQLQEEEELLAILARIDQTASEAAGKRKSGGGRRGSRASSSAVLKKRRRDAAGDSDEDEDVHAELSDEDEQTQRRSSSSRRSSHGAVGGPKKAPHVQVRSAQLLHLGSISKETTLRLQETLDSHGVGVLHSYTGAAVDAFVHLRKSILRMFELQKHISKQEYVVSLLQQQLQAKQQQQQM